MIDYIGLFAGAFFFVCGLLFFLYKKVPFFEPMFREDFPEDHKPFFRMNKCHFRATAYPRHKLLPELEKVVAIDGGINKMREVDIMAYKFQYEGYDQGDKWNKTLVKILDGHGKVRLLGGVPSNKRLKDLRVLSDKGAEIRFLPEPPRTHVFIYLCESNTENAEKKSKTSGYNQKVYKDKWKGEKGKSKCVPGLIWFEEDHEDKKATCVVYTLSPSKEDREMAIAYYSKIWDTGTPINKEIPA